MSPKKKKQVIPTVAILSANLLNIAVVCAAYLINVLLFHIILRLDGQGLLYGSI